MNSVIMMGHPGRPVYAVAVPGPKIIQRTGRLIRLGCQTGEVSSEQPVVVSVSAHARHRFSKTPAEQITLIAGHGVEGDAHAGATVKHRSRRRWNPSAPNLRQVHLIAAELFDELAGQGFR